ncbi:MAG: NRDE family protein [Steroidobacteraceae bacterium]
MCLLVLAWQAHPRYRLLIAANRDEYHDRPAAALSRWPAPDDILAGRDLRAGGTWLGIDRRRRFGVVTNFRDLVRAPPGAASRGSLIPRYLAGAAGPGEYLGALEHEAAGYGGFNLLLADDTSLCYGSNRGSPFARALSAGVHGLSNERLDTPWPKLRRVRRRFENWLGCRSDAESGELFALLGDREPAADGLPNTGLSPEWERTLSSPFVLHESYGTRCSTIVAIEPTGRCYLAERRFDASGACSGESAYRLAPGEWPE